MIKRFRHKGLEALFRDGKARGLDARFVPKLRRMLTLLEDGELPEAMNQPGFRLHQLKGAGIGVWSVWVTGNFRLTFEVDEGDAVNVDLVDYH